VLYLRIVQALVAGWISLRKTLLGTQQFIHSTMISPFKWQRLKVALNYEYSGSSHIKMPYIKLTKEAEKGKSIHKHILYVYVYECQVIYVYNL
jgi:hypothetical protein